MVRPCTLGAVSRFDLLPSAIITELRLLRVLIVTPHFPPANMPDMQRVRLILPYLREEGVEAEVLAVDADQVAAPSDPWLAEGLPSEVPVHRVRALDRRWRRLPGLGSLTFRAIGALRRQGNALLANGGFDVVLFSTGEFAFCVLGKYWKKKYGVPFVLDYQDPWVSTYYRDHPDAAPPGGRLKYAIANRVASYQEPRVLRDCSGIVSVSAAYPEQLAIRYPWLEVAGTSGAPEQGRILSSSRCRLPSLVLPFPGDELDIERVKADGVRAELFDPQDHCLHWVYVGVCPPSMRFALRALFAAVRRESLASPRLASRLKMHFIGTSYAPAGTGKRNVEALAQEYGLQGNVREHPDRIPYSAALRCLLDADTLIVPGSDDPAYTASKIYPYLLARRPMLAIFHQQSSVVGLVRGAGGGHVVTFGSGEGLEDTADKIRAVPGFSAFAPTAVPLDGSAFYPHSARASAGRLSAFLRHVIAQPT